MVKYKWYFNVMIHIFAMLMPVTTIMMLVSCKNKQYIAKEPKFQLTNMVKQYPYTVVATTGMVYDVVKNIVGNHANVIQIMPTGTDPHTYIPTRTDIVKIYDADIVIYSGFHLEGGTYTILSRIAEKKPIYAYTSFIKEDLLLHDIKGATDPHVWMDVDVWGNGAIHLAHLFAQYDPTNSVYYNEQGKNYSQLLGRLNGYILDMIQSIPEEQQVLVTSHDAFQYFSRAYSIEVYGIQGISTVSEASLNYINTLVSLIIDRRVPAIFVESSISPKYIQVIIEGVKGNGHTLSEGGVLYSDAMGAPYTYEGTYIGMMDHNARTITASLGGIVSTKTFLEIEKERKYETTK